MCSSWTRNHGEARRRDTTHAHVGGHVCCRVAAGGAPVTLRRSLLEGAFFVAVDECSVCVCDDDNMCMGARCVRFRCGLRRGGSGIYWRGY